MGEGHVSQPNGLCNWSSVFPKETDGALIERVPYLLPKTFHPFSNGTWPLFETFVFSSPDRRLQSCFLLSQGRVVSCFCRPPRRVNIVGLQRLMRCGYAKPSNTTLRVHSLNPLLLNFKTYYEYVLCSHKHTFTIIVLGTTINTRNIRTMRHAISWQMLYPASLELFTPVPTSHHDLRVKASCWCMQVTNTPNSSRAWGRWWRGLLCHVRGIHFLRSTRSTESIP